MLNHAIFTKDPKANRLINNGVAEVSEDHSESGLTILRYELETFVCNGQYAKGMERVIDAFLKNLANAAEQPGVWISGFYGSGKSHLAKMLRTLWTDYKFTDGAAARSLARLPDAVAQPLKELTIQGKRHGGLHAAAGKLGAGAGDKVRLALLAIIFKSKGLPAQYNQADLVLWLKREGLLDAIEAPLKLAGRSLAQELPHMYVSNHLARALLAVRPGMANTEPEARQLLKAQFPQVQDVSNEQMVNAITEALSDGGNFPLTLVVLDEVQQYIGNDVEKAYLESTHQPAGARQRTWPFWRHCGRKRGHPDPTQPAGRARCRAPLAGPHRRPTAPGAKRQTARLHNRLCHATSASVCRRRLDQADGCSAHPVNARPSPDTAEGH